MRQGVRVVFGFVGETIEMLFRSFCIDVVERLVEGRVSLYFWTNSVDKYVRFFMHDEFFMKMSS